MLTDKEFFFDFQKRVHDFCMVELELALEYPVDIVKLGAVICSKDGPMFSREMIE